MKNVLFSFMLFAASTMANATDLNVSVTGVSNLIERGASLTAGEPTVVVDVEATDVLVDGLYVKASTTNVDMFPLGTEKTFYSTLKAGYAFDFKKYNFDFGVTRVFNPVSYADNYTRATFVMSKELAENWEYVASVSKIVYGDVSKDMYLETGIYRHNLFTDGLTLGASLSAYDLDVQNETLFNTVNFDAMYKVNDNVSAFATYVVGGSRVNRTLDSSLNYIQNRPSDLMVGVTYTF